MQAARPAYHHGDLRRTLVREGLRLVERHGIGKLTLASLASHCGVSTPALYHHFRDKDALMTELGLAALARFEAAIAGALGSEGTGIDLDAFARAYVTFAMAHPELYDLTFGRATWQRPTRGPLHTRAKGSFKAFVARLRSEQEHGRLAPGEDPLRLAQVAWATLHGLARMHGDGLAFSRRAVLDIAAHASRLLSRALRGSSELTRSAPPRSDPPRAESSAEPGAPPRRAPRRNARPPRGTEPLPRETPRARTARARATPPKTPAPPARRR